jgi:hypothetical protein
VASAEDPTVRAKLEALFDRDWDDVAVIIETAAAKSDRTHDEVISDLLSRAERKPGAQTRVKRSVIRWIGKPWRERENPWDRFKDRLPQAPPRTDQSADDLEEWTPLRPDDD